MEEAIPLAKTCIAALAPTAPFAGIAHVTLARTYAMCGDLAAAQTHVQQGLQVLLIEPAVCPLAFATLARISLQRGDHAAAQQACAVKLNRTAPAANSSRRIRR